MLTLVASIDLWFSNEGRAVARIAAEEDVSRISVSSAYI